MEEYWDAGMVEARDISITELHVHCSQKGNHLPDVRLWARTEQISEIDVKDTMSLAESRLS